jgi:hypothetical protein
MLSTNKYQILETITAVSRLITLPFKPKGTKISIRDHIIVLCEPSQNKYYGFSMAMPQSVDRFLNGDSREDLWILNKVIFRFVSWYIIPYKNDDPEIYTGLINMAKYLCVALRHLQNIYKTGTVVGTLQCFILILLSVVNDTFVPELFYNPSETSNISFLDDDCDIGYEDIETTVYSTIFDVDKFKHFWSKEELKSLIKQFDQCFRPYEEPDTIIFKENETISVAKVVIDLLDNVLPKNIVSDDDEILSNHGADYHTHSRKNSNKDDDGSDDNENPGMGFNMFEEEDVDAEVQVPKVEKKIEKIEKIIEKVVEKKIEKKVDERVIKNTGSSIYKKLPIPKSLNNVIVRGHLTGITDILRMMDKKFTTMLSQSVKGTN